MRRIRAPVEAKVAVTKAAQVREPMNEGIRKERKPNGFYAKMGDDELIATAKSIMKEMGIRCWKELDKAAPGLCTLLKRREKIKPGIIERVGFAQIRKPRGFYSNMSEGEMLCYSRKVIEEKGARNPTELKKADLAFYLVLRARNLLRKVGFENIRRNRKWGSDSDVLDTARKLIEEQQIRNSNGLLMADSGLHRILRGRNLLGKLKFEERRELRWWGSDSEVLDTASKLIKDKQIRNSKELVMADSGLHHVLVRRRLIYKVFDPLRQESKSRALRAIKKATESFGK